MTSRTPLSCSPAPRDQPTAADRVARWNATGNPQDLWPASSPEDRLAAHRLVSATARAVLSGEQPPPLQLPRPEALAAMGAAAFVSGLGPLLGYWIERGTVEAPASVADLVRAHYASAARRSARLTAATLEILDRGAERGLAFILLKGMHTAHEYFPDPGTRPAADVDVLVAPGDAGAAEELLAQLGFDEMRPATDGTRSEWYRRGVARMPITLDAEHEDNRWAVDLHFALTRRYYRGLRAGLPQPVAHELVDRN
ncbi:MAG: nucleotidyltransferase family protein [Gemmatimonadetes bacterium]|nr:nucleotidyltransferase family protein [Gemmatimonadota bacterium]